MSKRQVEEALQGFFSGRPNETFTVKQVFKSLHFDTHPLKMLALDVMEEMQWDDYLQKDGNGAYRLNQIGRAHV